MADARKRVAVVTGANQGIGFEAACGLAAAGFAVVVCGRSSERGEDGARRVRERVPDHADHVYAGCVELTDPASVAAFGAALDAQFGVGGIDVLVNNAGFAYKGSTFGADEAAHTIDVNLRGTKAVTEVVVPLMVGDGSGRVVTVGSRAGKLAQVGAELQARFAADDVTYEQIDALADEFVGVVRGGGELGEWPASMYGVSKLCLNAWVLKVLARDLTTVTPTLMCPGYCSTSMSSHKGTRTAAKGAETIIWLATADPAPSRGVFYADCEPIPW